MTGRLILLLPLLAAAAPLPLYAPPGNDLSSSTTATAKSCGDLSSPCQSTFGQSSLSWTAPSGPGFTYGGSLGGGIGAVSGAKGPVTAIAGSFWVQSPDGQWTLAVGVSRQTYPGYNVGQGGMPGGLMFGRH